EAQLILGLLESNGIAGVTSADDAGGLEPQWQLTQGVRVLVAAEDEERARDLIAEAEEGAAAAAEAEADAVAAAGGESPSSPLEAWWRATVNIGGGSTRPSDRSRSSWPISGTNLKPSPLNPVASVIGPNRSMTNRPLSVLSYRQLIGVERSGSRPGSQSRTYVCRIASRMDSGS